MARAIKIMSGSTELFDGLNNVGFSSTGQNQTTLFADTDMPDDWFEESFELLLNSDTTQSAKTNNVPSSNEFKEIDITQQVMKQASKRRTYRRRLKDERETLKRRESELIKDLSHLQMVKKEEKRKLEDSRTAEYIFWKATACRQLEQRMIAEAEQTRLFTTIRIQSTYINSLQEIIQKRSHQDAFGTLDD